MNKRLTILSKYSPVLIVLALGVYWVPDLVEDEKLYFKLFDISRAVFLFIVSLILYLVIPWKFQRLRFVLFINWAGWFFNMWQEIVTDNLGWSTGDKIGLIFLAVATTIYIFSHTKWKSFEPFFHKSQWPK